MNMIDRILNIDRRIIYLLVGIATVAPFLYPSKMKIKTTPEVESAYEYINSLPEGSYMMLASDYDPQTQAENEPQAKAILRHMFMRNFKVIVLALSQDGAALTEMLTTSVSKEYNKVKGVDYAYLGFKPYPNIIILSMGEDFRLSYPTDFYNVKLDDIPMLKNIKNYNDLKGVVEVGGGNVSTMWIQSAVERYKVKLAIACTAVSGPQYYANLQAKQIFGLIAGLKGAAEYETLLLDEYKRLDVPTKAIQGMNVQNFVHLLIIFLTILGNIAFFYKKRAVRGE
jgi:hypothetical protein